MGTKDEGDGVCSLLAAREVRPRNGHFRATEASLATTQILPHLRFHSLGSLPVPVYAF